MDAFALSLGCAVSHEKGLFKLPFFVGIFHFIMPLIGHILGGALVNKLIFDTKYILFLVFLILSIDMLLSFFEKKTFEKKLNTLNILIFSLSVSIDSLTLGFAVDYLYSNILLITTIFCLISFLFTFIGIILGRLMSKKIHKYAYLIGAVILFAYSFIVLTK